MIIDIFILFFKNIRKMETLTKDTLTKIALELSPPDLINFCSTNKKNNICSSENKDFWRLKIQRDYPKVFNYYKIQNITLVNPKNTYIRKFIEVSKAIENFIEDVLEEKLMREFPKVKKENFDNIQKKELFTKLYDLYQTLLPQYPGIRSDAIEATAAKYFPPKSKTNRIDYPLGKIRSLMVSLLTKDKMYEIKK